MTKVSSSKAALVLAASAFLLVPGCAEDGTEGSDNGPAGGKADEADEIAPADFKCQDITNRSQRSGNILERLSDPMADMLKLSGCAQGFRDLIERWEETDAEGCDGGNGAGHTTFVVTEHGQTTRAGAETWEPRGDTLRTVTSRRCNNRQNFELLTSVFANDNGQIGDNVEVMAFDRDEQEYNYYEASREGVTFFGSSADIMSGDAGKCAGCHTGGGAVMKELRNPWSNWESGAVTPGAEKLVEENEFLGRKSGGSSFENLVKSGNRAWNATRVALMTDREGDFTPEDMLRPAFCTTEINTDNAGLSADEAPDHMPQNALAHCKLYGSCGSTHTGENSGPRFSEEDYKAAAADAGQRVRGLNRDDLLFAFGYAEPSVGEIDYLDQLAGTGAVDDELIGDILAVELTKPVFSDIRCDILDEIDLTWDDIEEGPAGEDGRPTVTADAVRAALISELEGIETPSRGATQLLADLGVENLDAHREATTAYISACSSRATDDVAGYLKDVFTFAAFHRKEALSFSVMEDKEALLASVGGSSDETFWNGETCELGDSPVFPVAPAGGGGEEPPPPDDDSGGDDMPPPDDGGTDSDGGDDTGMCADRCGTDLEFDENASCQCDTGCRDAGDCCEGMICE